MLDKFSGCLIGLACGDALGLPFEYKKRESVNEYLDNNPLEMRPFSFGDNKYPVGFYSDDTSQMICLAESLIEKGFDPEDQFKRYKMWFRDGYASAKGVCFGVGQNTFSVLSNQKEVPTEISHNPNAGGNGALMRCAPVALYSHGDIKSIVQNSINSAIVTHNNEIAAYTCAFLNVAISLLISGIDKSAVIKKVESLDILWPKEIDCIFSTNFEKLLSDDVPCSGSSLDTLRVALWSFLNADTFKASIETAIRFGGDTDTFGAVTGAMAGSFYGYDAVPDSWKTKIINKERILTVASNMLKNVNH